MFSFSLFYFSNYLFRNNVRRIIFIFYFYSLRPLRISRTFSDCSFA